MNRTLLLFVLLGFATAGCRTAGPAPRPTTTAAAVPTEANLGQDHPLRGRIWDVSGKKFITEEQASARLAAAKFVLLGEKHDNPAHHLNQARMVRTLAKAGRAMAVAWEMISDKEAAALAKALAVRPVDFAGLGAALRWEPRGWPDWSIYQPVAEAAVTHGATLLPAAITREETMAMVHGKSAWQPPATLPSDAAARLEQDIRASHCGHAGAKMVAMMTRIQQHRDMTMATRMLAGLQRHDRLVLIAGNGHARRDYGVPFYLADAGINVAQVLVLASLEVQPGRKDPAAYASPGHKYDLIWFTRRVDNDDPCEKFKEQLKRMKRKKRK